LRAATTSPVIGRAATPRQSRPVVLELPISRHDHRARRRRLPAEQPNDAPDSPRHASCTHHYSRRKAVQRLRFHLLLPSPLVDVISASFDPCR
jgi:hypothetical protein